MKNTVSYIALTAILMMTSSAFAQLIHTCESVKSIKDRATDEICDYYVDASEDCFEKLNERFTLLEARPAQTPPKDILTEAEPIKESYDAGVATLKTYLAEMKPNAVMCGDQSARVEVMIEELKADIKALSKRIGGIKSKVK